MTRSLCNWLATIALLAAPSIVHAQLMVGQSRLAPVALEARCRIADGMLDRSLRLAALGGDPLHATVMDQDEQDRQRRESVAQPDPAPDPQSLCGAETAASRSHAPADVSSHPGGTPAFSDGCYAPEFDWVDTCRPPQDPIATRAEPPRCRRVAKTARQSFCPLESLANPHSICPLAALAAYEPIDVESPPENDGTAIASDQSKDGFHLDLSLLTADRPQFAVNAASDHAGTRQAPASAAETICEMHGPYMPAPIKVAPAIEWEEEPSLVGSSPTIAQLREEYAPYDSVEPLPVRIDVMHQRLAARWPIADVPVQQLAGKSFPRLDEVLPLYGQLPVLVELYTVLQAEEARICWVDEHVRQIENWLAADGVVRSWMNGQQLGAELVHQHSRLLQTLTDLARPAVPVLAHTIEPPAAQPPQPLRFSAEELTLAASALQSAAGELESLASRLRTWGDSLHQIARVPQPAQRR